MQIKIADLFCAIRFGKVNLFRICISFLLICSASQALFAQQAKEGPSFIKVNGQVTKALTLTATELTKMKRQTTSFTDKTGKDHQYTGVAVMDILNLAGITSGKQLHGENLKKYLLVKCADGYEVVFSLAELDSSFNEKVVILADQVDGAPLPADRGPFRLIVPGEKRPARSCYQVAEFVVRFSKD